MVEFSESMVFTVDQMGKALGISRGTAYTAVREGRVPFLRIGRRILIPRAALENMLAEAKQGTGAS